MDDCVDEIGRGGTKLRRVEASSSSGKGKSSAGVEMYNTDLVNKVKGRRQYADVNGSEEGSEEEGSVYEDESE
jgi:hypothetical protein